MRCRQHVCFNSLFAGLALLSGQALIGFHGMRPEPPPPVDIKPLPLEQAPALLTGFCAGCHQAGRARIDLDGPVDRRAVRHDRRNWQKVLRVLRNEEMPPPKSPQLLTMDRQLLIRWLEAQFAALEADADCRLVARRLRRQEYGNAVRDLVGIAWQAPDGFPGDDSGWDLAAALPALSASLRPRYEAAADGVLAAADLDTPLAAVDAAGPQRARVLLAALARRAYRGPVPADEMARLNATFERATNAGAAPVEGLRAALRAVLTSPHFLFYIEERADVDGISDNHTTGEHELAARLASFLWRSIPDEALLQLADEGRLRTQLAGQVRRMLHDPRAGALARDFAGVWLGLDRLDYATHLPAALRQAMRQETESVVAHVFAQDRSVLEFLDADYTFLNERLATHYSIAGVRGEAMRRVSLAGTSRGGLVTQASFLAMTSVGSMASPVQRGKWILTNVLGTPPPAPPSGLLDGFFQPFKQSEPKSLAQILAKHREHSSCFHCHAQIDGLGLALGDFNGAGTWQPQGELTPEELVALPDGELLRNVADLKGYLLDRREQFLRALGGKLLGYALGRKMVESDQPALERLAARALPEPRFGNLLLEVVQSAPFQQRMWEP